MYMLGPITEFVQIRNFCNWIPIPNWNFHIRMFGMVSQSIQFSRIGPILVWEVTYISIYILCQFGRSRDWYNLQKSTDRLYNKPTCKFMFGIAIQFWNWTNSRFGCNIYPCVPFTGYTNVFRPMGHSRFYYWIVTFISWIYDHPSDVVFSLFFYPKTLRRTCYVRALLDF
jgi:hypothetical protein